MNVRHDWDEILQKAELSNIEGLHPFSGHCLEVALAIQEVLGGNILFCSIVPYEGYEHVVVEYEGKLYDGSGHVLWAKIVNTFIPSDQKMAIEHHFYSPQHIPHDKIMSNKYQDICGRLQTAKLTV